MSKKEKSSEIVNFHNLTNDIKKHERILHSIDEEKQQRSWSVKFLRFDFQRKIGLREEEDTKKWSLDEMIQYKKYLIETIHEYRGRVLVKDLGI